MLAVDSHRHLSGSISPTAVWQMLARSNDPRSLDEIRAQMMFGDDEEPDFARFLSKFTIFDEFTWDTNLIRMICQDVCHQLADEGTDYCLLDFSINKYVNSGWDPVEIIKLIHDYFDYFRPGAVGLVLSLTYESPKERQEQYASLITNPEVASRVVGIDLVGDEARFDVGFYATILTPWRSAGKMVRAHVGESQSAENVRHAILDLEVTNVAHGIKLFDTPDLVSLARERNITFDLALTSNYVTGVWRNRDTHPFRQMLDAGLSVTIGSDDPIVCNTTLKKEYKVAERLGADWNQQMTMAFYAYSNARRWALPGSVVLSQE